MRNRSNLCKKKWILKNLTIERFLTQGREMLYSFELQFDFMNVFLFTRKVVCPNFILCEIPLSFGPLKIL